VANWLDPAGFAEGYVFMRWQGLSRPLATDEAPTAELVDLVDLSARLSVTMRRFTQDERNEQLLRRRWVPIRRLP
jgi:hypothetical protein